MGVVWWIYGTSACSARRPTGRSWRSSTRASTRPPLERGPRPSTPSGLPPAEELNELERARSWPRSGRELRGRPRAAGSSCPSPNPSFGEAKADGRRALRREPRRRARARRRRGLRRRRTPSSAAARSTLADDPSRIDRIVHEVRDDLRRAPAPAALRHRAGAAGDRAGGRSPASRRPLPRPTETSRSSR